MKSVVITLLLLGFTGLYVQGQITGSSDKVSLSSTTKPSGVPMLEEILRKDGGRAMILKHQELSHETPVNYTFQEQDISAMGHRLMQEAKFDEAQAAFNLNLYLYRQSARTYADMGDFYVQTGNSPRAKAMYQGALEIDPAFTECKEKLEQLD